MLLACVLMPAVGQAQAPSPGVFSTLQTDLVPDIGVALEPATMRSRAVGVDTQRVAAARLGQQALRLNLFDDAAVSVQIDRVRPTRSGYFITGRPEGFEWGEVRLVVNGPVMVGTVVTPEGKYTIRYGGSGRHVIREVDPSQEALEDDVVESPPPATPPQTIAPGDPLPGLPQEIAPGNTLPGPPQAIAPGDPFGAVLRPATDAVQDQPTEDGSEVRVLVVYTPALQSEQGGAAGIQALVDLMIESANQAFEVSGIEPRLVLAHAALVDYVEVHRRTDLDRLVEPDDGYMDEVHALRNEHAADLVHLLTAGQTPGQRSGIAYRLEEENLELAETSAFAVTVGASEEIFTHEIGHNFGMNHDRFRDQANSSIYPYAFGYVNSRAFEPGAPETSRWRTIMAYNHHCGSAGFSCPRLFRFANPDQTWLGDPLGVPADHPVSAGGGPADARLTINRAARWIGSFRSEACTQFAVTTQTPVVPMDETEVVLKVDTAPGCLWEVSSRSEFATTEPGARRSGSGLVSIRVDANDTGAERNGTVSVAGVTVEFRQLATNAGICSRTPAVVQAIAVDEGCDEIDARRLAGITSLSVRGQGITTLKEGDFDGLLNLESLRIDDNRLTELPENLFAGLSRLDRLYIGRNPLAELPAGLFAGLSNLRYLNVSFTPLEALPDDVFAGLSTLRWLNLSSNELSALPDNVFAGLSEVESLSMGNQDLSELSPGAFVGLSGLIDLAIGNARYDTLPSGLFDGLDNLRALNIGGRRLTSLPEDLFVGLSSLDTLFFYNSPISDFPPGLFRGLSRLERLIIDNTYVRSLPEDLFADLTALELLLLPRNALESLPPGIFADLAALKRLDLAENLLSNLPDGVFAGLTSLEMLALEGNRADPLPIGMALKKVGDNQFKAVVPTGAPFDLALPVSSNGGTIDGSADTVTIPVGAVESSPTGVSRNADTQQRVTVDVGVLPDLPTGHSGYVLRKHESLPVSVLASLDPADAALSGLSLGEATLDPAFKPDTTVYSASVEHVVTSATVTPFTSNTSAEAEIRDASDAALADADADADGHQVSLDVGENVFRVAVTAENGVSTRTYTIVVTRHESNCNRTPQVLRALAEAVSDVESCGDLRHAHFAEITELDLSGMGISSLKAGDFAGLSALRSLRLDGNSLASLPDGVFSGLSELRDLRLDYNELSDLPGDAFSGLSSLESLTFSENNLTELPDGLLLGLTRLRVLLLNANAIPALPISVSLQRVDESRFKAVAPTGAPFALEISLSVSSGGEIEGGADSITIPVGAAESASLGVTRIDADIDTVTVDIATLPFFPRAHGGYSLEKDASLPLEIALPEEVAPPAQVTGVELARGFTSLRVSWTAVSGADGYKLQWKSGDEDYDDETRQAVVSGGDTLSYTITGLTVGAEYTVRVLATREGADDGPFSEEVGAATRSGDPDVNGDGVLDADDAQIMWYAYRFASLVGDGETGGTEASRRRFLGGYSGLDDPSDEDLRAMVARANTWRTEGLNEGGDINADGVIDDLDARAMYRAYRSASLLGDGVEGGAERFRLQLLGPLAGKADPTDEDLKAMLRRANELREAYG